MSHSLEELAMTYAILTVGLEDKLKDLALFGLTVVTTTDNWDAELTLFNMERQFGVYQAQEAIKEAKASLKLVIPEE